MKFVKCVFLMLLLSPVLPAFGQEFPSRPITMVVPFSAGGPGDVIARLLGTSMSATLKQAKTSSAPAARWAPIASPRLHLTAIRSC